MGPRPIAGCARVRPRSDPSRRWDPGGGHDTCRIPDSTTTAREPSPRETPQPNTREQIDNHLESLLESSDKLDWNRFANTFAPTATGFLSTPATVHRLENGTAVANAFKSSFDAPASKKTATSYPLPQNPRNTDIQRHGDAAIATFQTDHEYDRTGWWTVVLKRDDAASDWKVHHVHAHSQDPKISNSNMSSWP